MIFLALRFPDGFSTYPQVFHPKWKRRPAHQHITLHWRVFRYTSLLWRIITKIHQYSPIFTNGASSDIQTCFEEYSPKIWVHWKYTAPHMMYVCIKLKRDQMRSINSYFVDLSLKRGKKKHFFRPTVERRGLQVLSIDFSLFKYCSLVFAILKSHFEFELDPSSVFVEQLMLWICCDFKDSRFSKQQVYSRLIWVSLKKTKFFNSVFRQNLASFVLMYWRSKASKFCN